MGQSGWRLPDDLLRRVRVRCAESGERQNVFVVRALESALANLAIAGESKVSAQDRGGLPASSRASVPTVQRAVKVPPPLSNVTGGSFECPHGRCSERGVLGEPCPVHPNLKFKEPA